MPCVIIGMPLIIVELHMIPRLRIGLSTRSRHGSSMDEVDVPLLNPPVLL